MRLAALVFSAFCCLSSPASAFVVAPCGPEFSPVTITEPWEENSQAFANGAIRIFEIFIDPNVASGASLGILHPITDEHGFVRRACTAIYYNGLPRYFGQVHVAQAAAVYDASVGLIITVPISFTDGRGTIPVRFAVNQATGVVSLL